MKCPNCGAVFDATDSRYIDCSYCGTRFENPSLPRSAPAAGGIAGMMNAMFEDKNNDGVPDIFQQPGAADVSHTTVVSSSVTVNGKTYERMEDVPEEIRKILGSFGGGMGLGGNGAVTSAQLETTVQNKQTFFPSQKKSGLLKAIILFGLGVAVAGLIVMLTR